VRRMLKLFIAVCTVGAALAAVAAAASSPTVATGSATNLRNTSAVVQAGVNPNGTSTAYMFQYGLTNAYGLATTTHSAGAGTKGKAVSATIGGLTPGTLYHYRVVAVNKAGTSAGADRTFRTTGHPPAGVLTGPPDQVGTTTATVTGTVNPEGQTTVWVFQYGLTTTYGVQTFGQTLAGVSSTLTVASQLAGLTPGTLFHYRLVAFHGSTVVSAGVDQTFLTEPSPRPVPRLRASTSPARARSKPFLFTTRATVVGPGWIPAPLACTSSAAIRYFNGKRLVGFAVGVVQPNCTLSAQVSFPRRIGRHPTRLKVVIHFRGNGYLAPVDRTDHVTLG
jgi:phosphodiesterase/alkaline phosphatase D-like protein